MVRDKRRHCSRNVPISYATLERFIIQTLYAVYLNKSRERVGTESISRTGRYVSSSRYIPLRRENRRIGVSRHSSLESSITNTYASSTRKLHVCTYIINNTGSTAPSDSFTWNVISKMISFYPLARTYDQSALFVRTTVPAII